MNIFEIISYIRMRKKVVGVNAKLAKKSQKFALEVANQMLRTGSSSILNGRILYDIDYYRSNSGKRADRLILVRGRSYCKKSLAKRFISGNLIAPPLGLNERTDMYDFKYRWMRSACREDVLEFSALTEQILFELKELSKKANPLLPAPQYNTDDWQTSH